MNKRGQLLNSYPGVLLLGDWHGEEVTLEFFESVKEELVLHHHCNAFTLNDIKAKMDDASADTPEISTAQIRDKGLDEADIVLWVDGDGKGTVSESSVICGNPGWNSKCLPLVKGKPQDHETILASKDYLKDFDNDIIYYDSIDELRALLVQRGQHASRVWVKTQLAGERTAD
ncbi:hypothetical protein HY995_03055 [Candidatus Micrarchaeota archaeon]|nr:hypothetical protein [Candidatus Micrarchaeota archaeon]